MKYQKFDHENKGKCQEAEKWDLREIARFEWKCSILYRSNFFQNFSHLATYVYTKDNTHTASDRGDECRKKKTDLPENIESEMSAVKAVLGTE